MLKVQVALILSVALLLGCSTKTTSTSGEDPNSPTYPGPAETTYCATPVTYSGSTVTISGTAQYLRREVWGSAGSGGLGGASTGSTHPATLNPIRRAEVRVLGPSGTVTQCTETDNSGSFSFVLPTSSISVHTIYINSRAFNGYLKASVLNKPANNQFYSLTTSFTPDVSKTLSTVIAPADGAATGAAFNILDQLLNANDYLRTKAGTCSFAGCTPFTVAPKVSAYWTAGFNPNEYFGSTSGLSFYLPGYSRLFILGGVSGNLNNSDTDHFDNSVIVHEYGHFLEDTMFASDSPGGAHNGNKVIDPRLAWSEGWGNFIQAAVHDDPRYIDTLGNDDGATSMAFYVDLETPDSHDTPNFSGEGNFREFAVTRTLWDMIDSNGDNQNSSTDNVADKFVEIWAALTKTTNSFKSTGVAFRSIGLLHMSQRNLATFEGATNMNAVRAMNLNSDGVADYAQYVTTGTCATYSFPKAAGYASDNGNISYSDLFRNNAFYHIRFSASGPHTILLEYQNVNGLTTEKDLDLRVYNESARIGVSSDIVGLSWARPDFVWTTAQTETVTASFAAGDYLINVNVFTNDAPVVGAVNYTLKLDGVTLCPADIIPQ